MSTLLGDARVRLRADATGFEADASRSIGGAMKKVAGVAAAAFAAAGVVGFGRDIINLSSQAEQSVGGVEAVFKEYASTVQASSKAADRALGLSANSYRELATVIGSQLKNAGVPMDELGGKTDSLISQGADLAAMFGGTTQEAVNALSSALKGEMDPIERYGISLNDAALKAEALSLGVYSGTGNLDANAKAMAVMSLITKQGADSMGAFGRESDTAAGKQQRATAQWENFKTVLGDQLLPVFSTVVGFLSDKVLPGLETFSNFISTTVVPGISGLYDLVVNGDFAGAFAGAFNVAEDSPVVDYILTAREAIVGFKDLLLSGDITSGLLTAFNIQEDNPVLGWVLDARNAVLNVWEGVGNFWDGLDLSGLTDRVREAVTGVGGELISGLVTGVESGDWSSFGESLTTAVGDALRGAAGLAVTLFEWVKDQLGKVDWVGLGIAIGAQVPTMLAGLALGILNFDLGGLLSGLADNWFEVLMGILAIVFMPAKILGKVADLLRKIPLVGRFLAWFLEGIQGVGRSILGWVGDLVGGFARGFTGGGSRIVDAVKGVFETVKTQLFVWGDDILIWFRSLPGKFVEVATYLGAALRQKFDEIVFWLGSIIRTGVDNVVAFFAPITGRLAAIAQDAWTWVVAKFTGMRDAVAGVFTGIRDGAVSIWTGFRDRVVAIAGDVWTWVTDRFNSMRSGVVSIFQNVADTVGNIWNTILDKVKEPVRIVVRFINGSIIDNINTVTSPFGLTIPKIPLNFHTGGIVPGGYSPGVDNQLAAVGSGEAIMRPEWTRAMGAGYVDAANRAARNGGVSGVQEFLRQGGPGFSNGGIMEKDSGGPLDWIGDRATGAWNWARDGIEGLVARGAAFALKTLIQPAVGWITDNVGNPLVSKMASGAMDQLIAKAENWGQGKDNEAAANAATVTDAGVMALPAGGAAAPGRTWQSLFSTIRGAFPQANNNSAYRPGDNGFHGSGQAIDLGQVGRTGGNGHPYLAAMNAWIYRNFPNSRELIYTGAGDSTSDLKNGRPHTYNAAVNRGHKNHVHWVYDNGGVLDPGLTQVNNKSGKPEAVFNNDQWKVFKRIADGGGSVPLIGGNLVLQAAPGASVNDQMETAVFELRRLARGGRP